MLTIPPEAYPVAVDIRNDGGYLLESLLVLDPEAFPDLHRYQGVAILHITFARPLG